MDFKEIGPMSLFAKIFICLIFWQPLVQADQATEERVLNRQMRRKVSFDQHQRDKVERSQKRGKKAFKHKIARVVRELQKEKARLSFRRTYRAFPLGEWREFLRKRKTKKAQNKNLRREYGRIRKKLEKIKQSNKYRIDKNIEYQL